MKALLPLDGIVTVLNTPFTGRDTIDTEGLRRNVALALDAGVAGFLVPAMAGEVDKLTQAERDLMVATVVETVRGRATVIGGASAKTASDRVAAARRVIDLGCDGVLASIPYENDDAYRKAVEKLDALRPGFLMLQDWDFGGGGLPLPLIVRLFDEVESFRCLKVEVVPAGVKYSAVIAATAGRLHGSGGWAVMQMIEALDRGVHAFMPTGLHRVYTRIHALYRADSRDEARALFDRLLPVIAFSNQHLDISIHFFKRLLHAQGVYATALVREPILPFDEHHERTARALIAYAMRLEEELAPTNRVVGGTRPLWP